MTATIRHLLPLAFIMGMLAVSLTFARIMLSVIGRSFRRPDRRKAPAGKGPVIEGSYVDLTPGASPTARPADGAPAAPPTAPGR